MIKKLTCVSMVSLAACFGMAQADDWTVLTPSSKLTSCGPDAPSECKHVLLQGDPKTGSSQHVYHLPAGWVFVKHWKTGTEDLVMTKGTVKISAEGQPEKTMKVGDYLHIPPKVVHWGTCPEECEFYLGVTGPDSFNVVEEKKQ